jgi:hypothetical protein
MSFALADTRSSILQIAESQLGHGDQDQGCPANGCYMGFGRNWCSEFVSWVYHEAQVPFDGGKPVDWLLNDTGKIISWFTAENAYIDRNNPNWLNFIPATGDYIFIGRVGSNGALTNRQHSGIVEFIDNQGALHTIEGNNNGRPVDRYVYPNYKTNLTDNGPSNGVVLGFGHRNF